MLCRVVRDRWLLVVAVYSLLSVGTPPLTACQVPVFRYALENWEPDRLEVFVVYDGSLGEKEQAIVERLKAASLGEEVQTNFRWHTVDAKAKHAANSLEAFVVKQCGEKSLPQLQVYFSMASSPQPTLAWAADFGSPALDHLLSSPKRDEVVRRLLDGQSGVWVLLKSGDAEADRRAEELLRQELEKKPDQIELPSLTDLTQEEKFDESLNVELRVEFSLLTLDPTEESETFFRSMLLNTEPDLKEFNEPIAIPIYGRGRTFFALVGPGITPDNIADNCNFICGACSCEIKSQNPGHDLLLAANWQQVEPGNWFNDTPLPALTGIGQLDEIVSDPEAVDVEETQPADAVMKLTVQAGDEADRAAHENLVAMISEAGSREEVTVETKPKAAAPSESDSALSIVVLSWIGVLLCLGIGFTLWRRSHSSE